MVRSAPLSSGAAKTTFHSAFCGSTDVWARFDTCMVRTIDDAPAGDGNGSPTFTERMSRPAFAGAPRWLPAGEVTTATPGSLHGSPAGGAGSATSSPAFALVPTALVAVTW